MKSELSISPYALYTVVKLKEELEDVIETIEIMNEKQKRLHQTFLQAKTFTKKNAYASFLQAKTITKKMLMQQSFRKSLIKNASLQSSQNCSH